MQEDLVNNIGEIVEADRINLTYDTPAWYVLFSILFLTVVFSINFLYKKWLSQKYKREAVSRLKEIYHDPTGYSISDVNLVLKYVAIKSYGRSVVGSLNSNLWIDFLESTSKVRFNIKQDEIFYSETYGNEDLHNFTKSSIKWIKSHK